jgi:S-adenosylmethionine:tRNA ribosyltransferase-isomerase
MRVDRFDFALPRDLIAAHPKRPRDAARLLVVGARLEDRVIRDLPGLLRAGDILVFNDTKVIPARLHGRLADTGGRVELLLLRDLGRDRWRALGKPAKKLTPGRRVDCGGLLAEIAAKREDGEVELAFDRSGRALARALARVGIMPLPPYIERPDAGDPRDRRDYQTIFARTAGAVAAPTAGLHFTRRLLAGLAGRGIKHTRVTLHVGAGTFLPVKVADTDDHAMHAEWGAVSAAAARSVNAARAAGGRVVAVGTTSLRLLETAAAADGRVAPFAGETDLFIVPGYRFKAVDLMLTNFHLPRSTLFMLVAAFAGLERMHAAYAHAIARRYRFFSYGDACLLERGA